MSATITEQHDFVEDVVATVLGVSADSHMEVEFGESIHRLREELDAGTAKSYGASLVQSLCEDSSNPRTLAALVVIGIAYPDVARAHRVDLVTEGKRLATLFERAGEPEQARDVLETMAREMPEERSLDHELAGVMRRNGDVDELIDRYLARADEAVAKSRPLDAVPWLQEVLLLDRSRRDVARMIRDLRFSESDRKTRSSRRNRVLGVPLLISTLITSFIVREFDIRSEFRSLAPVIEGDLASFETRLAAIDQLVADNQFWLGMYGVMTERHRLIGDIAELNEQLAREQRESVRLDEQRAGLAEAARERGLMLARRGDFDAALRDLRHSLELTDADWEHRERVLADVAAIEGYTNGDDQ